MSETSFPMNDLLRRKLQTSLTIISLTTCVTSTLFLLLFSERLGFGISLMIGNRLTAGFSTVFSRFMIFIAFLIFVVGVVIISFMVFVMMSQRIRDIGLMKATGCPNDLIFGYFMTELLMVTFIACCLGVTLAILADLASASLLSSLGFQVSQGPINLWLVLFVFVLFFVLALIFGAKPILDTTKIKPVMAISPTHFVGLSKETGFRVTSRSGLTMKIALRSLFRRRSATIRIILCLAFVFILVTVGIAGGLIADRTTKSWIEKAIGRDVVLVGHQDVCNQYRRQLSKFYEAGEGLPFDYLNKSYLISEDLLSQLDSISEVTYIDKRLVLEAHVEEVQGYIIDPETASTIPVGDDREGESLIVGIEPGKALGEWFLEGEPLRNDEAREAIVGDTLALKMFSVPTSQSMKVFDSDFDVIGVCLDPINNGNVTYVPLKTLQNVTGVLELNVVMAKIDPFADRAATLDQVRAKVKNLNVEFDVLDLNKVLDKNLSFLGYVWSIIMFLPLTSLFTASLCLIGYVMLTINEQRQELGVLRALGAKPRTIVRVVFGQSFIVLLSSCAVGVAFGIIVTLLILVREPVVTAYTVVEIAGWLMVAFAIMLGLSLYPAVKFAKKPILEVMAQV